MVYNLLNQYKGNSEALEVIRIINYTNDSVFLTGKAGTGKSTLLKKITSQLNRNFIIVAPTGIAAINVGGQTIHSFFRIAPRPYLPEDKDIEFIENKQEILKNLDLIVIDEVSMVRADVMNAIDLSLKKNLKSSKPFAGIQLLMIGDLFQLPPVIDSKKLNEVEILGNYQTPYFFSCKSFDRGFVYHIVELQKVYRQSDEKFIHLLNAVRENVITSQDLLNLNNRYNPTYEPAPNSDEITLATTNQIVTDINASKLNSISSSQYRFNALTTGAFETDRSTTKLPTDKILSIKVNAQIMFIKNDTGEHRRWVNGSLGKVISIDEAEITVYISSTKTTHQVERVTWEDIEYVWNKKEEKIEQKVVGTFTQFPIKLAWAVTIHKSQGQTFDKTIINLGTGAFTTGQTYVALSRCTTFEGITLKTQVRKSDIKVDSKVQTFLNNKQQQNMEADKYDSIINGLETKLRTYNDKNDNLLSERQAYLKNIEIANRHLQQCKADLAVKEKTVSDLLNQNRSLKNEVQSLNAKLEKALSGTNGYVIAIVFLIAVCAFLIYKMLQT